MPPLQLQAHSLQCLGAVCTHHHQQQHHSIPTQAHSPLLQPLQLHPGHQQRWHTRSPRQRLIPCAATSRSTLLPAAAVSCSIHTSSSSSSSSSSTSSSRSSAALQPQRQRGRPRSVLCHARKATKQQQDAAAAADTSAAAAASAPRERIMLQVSPGDGENNPPVFVGFDPGTMELLPKYVVTEELLEGLDGVDPTPAHQLGLPQRGVPAPAAAAAAADAAAAAADSLSVPDLRVVTDYEELGLIGEGLPIINGEEWPEMYWRALQDLNSGTALPVPQPHPKFSMEDMRRIASQGPSFSDVVLEHAELINHPHHSPLLGSDLPDRPMAEAYNYVPFSVLGDYRSDLEPNWLQLPQMHPAVFLQGLKHRNWTSPEYKPDVSPWRIQFYRCGYQAVSGWPGWRAVVTSLADNNNNSSSSGGGGVLSKAWVDLPACGPDAFLQDYATAVGVESVWAPKRVSQSDESPQLMGFNQAFEQVFQAYEQRLPAAAVREMTQHNAVQTGAYPYDCPGEQLLDVSWHITANPAPGGLNSFLMDPNLAAVVGAVRTVLDNSGIAQLKSLRDDVIFRFVRPLPPLPFAWNPNNVGPLYFLVVLTLGVLIPSLRRSRILDIKTLEEDPGAAQEFARSKAAARKEGLTGVEFKDIAGLDPILGEVLEVVEFLKDPKTFSKLGARPPKGILLEGEPGTGKTLMAKALAGEAMVPFYQMSGTEFTEGIVGLGAARVRDLFKRARVAAPCVIFVDELDALGLKRASGEGNANEEREQTLNQLLTEMDGFTPDTGVVFLGATNRADLLDPALLRPGRFDRKIRMPRPDTEGRYEILRLQLASKSVSPDVDLLQLARDLPGLVGADLANIVNEAQLNAVRAGHPQITRKDMYAGVDRFTQGETRPALPTSHRLPLLAFTAKEVGIALVASVLRARYNRIEPVERVSVQPKGRSYSRTLFARGTDEDYNMITRGRLLDRMRVAVAGSLAAKMVLGEDTNFNIADIRRVRRMAERFVFYYGMSDFGITTWAQQPYSHDFAVGSNRPRKVISVDAMDAAADWPTRIEELRFDPQDVSDPTWHRYTDEVRKVIKQCYEDVWTILGEHREALWAGIAALSKSKEMLGGELRDVFDAHPPKPQGADGDHMPGVLDGMQVWTPEGREQPWPYGVDWFMDTYTMPHWVREKIKQQQQEQLGQQQEGAEEEGEKTAGAAGSSGGSSS